MARRKATLVAREVERFWGSLAAIAERQPRSEDAAAPAHLRFAVRAATLPGLRTYPGKPIFP